MKNIRWLWVHLVFFVSYSGFSQEEGPLEKKARVAKAKIVFVSTGLSVKILNNKGDYKGGLFLEGGLMKRFNKVLSMGPSVSYMKFNYDPSISNSFDNPGAKGNNVFPEDAGYAIRVVDLQGGDLSFISAGYNVKLDIIPFRDNMKFSPYVIARPFIMSAKRTEITATSMIYYSSTIPRGDPGTWELSETEFLDHKSPGHGEWRSESGFYGGMNIGIGSEMMLTSKWRLSLQSVIGLTLPVSYISTSSFPASLERGYNAENYPLVKKGFTSLNISIGFTYNF
jgi:hypothetical protein